MTGNVITLDEVREFIDVNGPAEERASWLSYYAVRFGEFLYRYPRNERMPRSVPSVSSRIDELLPKDGKIVLSGNHTTVVVYDEDSKQYRKALLELASLQPIPGEVEIDLRLYSPVGLVQILPSYIYKSGSFFGQGSAAAVFLEKIIELTAPLIEIGKCHDNCYPVKTYFR